MCRGMLPLAGERHSQRDRDGIADRNARCSARGRPSGGSVLVTRPPGTSPQAERAVGQPGVVPTRRTDGMHRSLCSPDTYLCHTSRRRTRLACGLATPRIRQGRAPITASAAHTATAEMAKADAAVGVIAAQAAWLLFVVFSLTAPRAPGDESNDDGNAKSARGSGRSKWRRGRRRCLLATARHWGAGAEDGEERRCGAAGDHGSRRRCAAAGEIRWSDLYHPVA